MQLFYRTHILGFLGFMVFGFAHHVSLWAYTLPGAHTDALAAGVRVYVPIYLNFTQFCHSVCRKHDVYNILQAGKGQLKYQPCLCAYCF